MVTVPDRTENLLHSELIDKGKNKVSMLMSTSHPSFLVKVYSVPSAKRRKWTELTILNFLAKNLLKGFSSKFA